MVIHRLIQIEHVCCFGWNNLHRNGLLFGQIFLNINVLSICVNVVFGCTKGFSESQTDR